MRQIILASQSPRRRELMALMGLSFDVMPSDFEEKLDHNRTPSVVTQELALGKALQIADQFPNAIVIGSDTIVSIDGKQIGKPANEDDARQILRRLSGRDHIVTTSAVIICKSFNLQLSGADETKVFFKPYDEAVIEGYVQTGEYKDKAGGYAIQGRGAALVDHIEGNYDTVIGLPTALLTKNLLRCGVHAHAAVLDSPFTQGDKING